MEFHVTLSGPFHKNFKNHSFHPCYGFHWGLIIEDTYKSLGIRKVLTIVTLPNKDNSTSHVPDIYNFVNFV